MSYLEDTEKRLLFSALNREKEICRKIDNEKVEDATCKMLVPVIESLERKFYYDRFEKEIRNQTIDEFTARLKERMEDTRWTTIFDASCIFENDKLNKCIKIVDEIAEEMRGAE